MNSIRLVLALGLACALPASAALQKAAGNSGTPAANTPAGADVVLYSQLTNPAGNGVPDQDFEASFNAYDSEAADDFIVTDASGWTINQVTTVGTTGTPGGSTVSVNFYPNSAGGGDPDLPGATAECSYTGLVPVDTLGSFTINLPTSCILPPGTHWVAIQVNQNFASFGQHFWSNRNTQTGSESVWRNPGDGFASGCTTFMPATACGVGGGASPDLLFTIVGQVGGLATDLSITKTGALNVSDQIVYTITVSNNGPSAATGVTVTDALPASVSFVSSDCGATGAPNLTWNIGNLANGASAVCNITVDVVTPGAIVNTATVSSDQTDPTPANDSSSATIVVQDTNVPPAIPTLNWVGLGVLLALLAASGLVLLRRQA